MGTLFFQFPDIKMKYDLIKENWVTEDSERYYLNQNISHKKIQQKDDLHKI